MLHSFAEDVRVDEYWAVRIAEAIAAERERCAKIAETEAHKCPSEEYETACLTIAEQIRKE